MVSVPKTFVVDEDLSVRLLYKMDFASTACDVITAVDGTEGVRLFELESPDLAVLDIRIPGMDGRVTMSMVLRRDPTVPIVLNSGYSSYKDSLLSWVGDAYVIKSSDMRELVAKIRDVLESRRRETRGLLDMSGSGPGKSQGAWQATLELNPTSRLNRRADAGHARCGC